MMKPSVYLIGAGPGDPGLITVHGLECLRRADVVIYDHLVSPRLLRHAKHTAELIDVGTAAPQPMAQEAISYLLVEKAREGKMVARLKWGDPFVFDRGGEEALFLQQHGIPFEVVPGIPAGIGVPAYAGVPVSYPGRRRHHHAGARLRGREPHAARHRLGGPGAARGHRGVLRRARSSCRSSSSRCARTAGPTTARPWSSTTARCPRSKRLTGTLAELLDATREPDAAARRPS